jgi:hypothetical protein
MRKTCSLAVAATLLLGACAQPHYAWMKDGASRYETTNVQSDCEYQVKLNKTPPSERNELIGLCMKGKGYRYRQVS